MLLSLFDRILCTVLGFPGILGMATSIIVILTFVFTFVMITLIISGGVEFKPGNFP